MSMSNQSTVEAIPAERVPSRSAASPTIPLSDQQIDLSMYLDISRIQALAHLFPLPGQQLFARLLAFALHVKEQEEESSPVPSAQGAYAAQICVQSQCVLGKLIGCKSNETLTKYLTVLRTCGFIEQCKVKHSRRVYLRLPSGPYAPPSNLLAELDALLVRKGARPKLRALVQHVRVRCLAHSYSAANTPGLSDDVSGSLQHILVVLQSERLESTQRITSAVSMLTRLLATTSQRSFSQGDGSVEDVAASHLNYKPTSGVPLLHSAQTSPKPGDTNLSEQSTTHLVSSTSLRQGDAKQNVQCSHQVTSPPPGDVSLLQAVHHSAASPRQGDAKQDVHRPHHVESPGKGDANPLQAAYEQEESPKQGDVNPLQSAPRQGKSPKQGDANRSKSEPVGDAAQSVGDSGDPANVNVTILMSNITFNVKLVAIFCCRALEEPPTRWRVYRKVFQEVDNDVQAITRALLFVLAHRADGSMRNPAAVFIQRCKDFHQAVPAHPNDFAEATSLLERYGHLTYQEVLTHLAAQRAQAASVQLRQSEHQVAPAYQTPAGLQPVPSLLTQAAEVHIPLKVGGGVSWEVALRLRKQIAHDIRFGTCRTTLVSLADGSYGVLVDKSREQKVRQCVLYTEQEWHQRSATLTTCYQLFGEKEPPGLALLKKALRGTHE